VLERRRELARADTIPEGREMTHTLLSTQQPSFTK
jgi:hypothetical protein